MRDSYATNGCILIQIPASPLLVQQVDARGICQ